MAPVIDIKFQNGQTMFFPGQIVNGIVTLFTDKIRVIKVIKFKVKGIGHVSFSYSDNNESKTASATETYYTHKFNLHGDGPTPGTFGIGTHEFNFSFVLPTGIPSSFESSTGYVRHTCRVAFDIEDKMFDAKYTAKFSVGAFYDLNDLPEAKSQIMMSNDKSLGCLCCAAGTISFMVNVDHSGYVPGEDIIINAECTNGSSRPTSYTEAKVIQTITYRAEGRKEVKTKDICSVKHPSVEAGKDDIWSGELLNIPPIPPSRLPGCSLIDIEYRLKFIFSPTGMSMNLSETAEIYIGSIPLRQVFNKLTPAPQNVPFGWSQPNVLSVNAPAPSVGFGVPQSAQATNVDLPPPYPWAELYPDLMPPSYSECPIGSRRPSDSEASDSDTAEGERKGPSRPFSPQYVSYGFQKP